MSNHGTRPASPMARRCSSWAAQRPDIVVLDADLYKSTRTVALRARPSPSASSTWASPRRTWSARRAGMAASGLVPFCNSLRHVPHRPLLLTRSASRSPIPRCNVKLVGSSAGLTQGPDGASHQSLEDVALMRACPT